MEGPEHFDIISPAELEFESEFEEVTIVPSFRQQERLELLGGAVGPFTPGVPCNVPLWLALVLKETQKCRVVCPDWLKAEGLEAALARERDDPRSLSPMPYFYVEIAELLLRHARDDLGGGGDGGGAGAGAGAGVGGGGTASGGADRIQKLLEEVQSHRERKLIMSSKSVLTEAQGQFIQQAILASNIGSDESNRLREGLMRGMDIIADFNRAQAARSQRLPSRPAADVADLPDDGLGGSGAGGAGDAAASTAFDDGGSGAGGGVGGLLRRRQLELVRKRQAQASANGDGGGGGAGAGAEGGRGDDDDDDGLGEARR